MQNADGIEMILMTKSSKYSEYCVAGFECETGRWIRLVSDNGQTHGAVSDEMLYDASKGRCADVLDRVRVEIKEACPGRVQSENMLVDGVGRIRILERVTIEAALRIHPCEKRAALFDSHHHIVQVDVSGLGHSLEFVHVQNVHIYPQIGSKGNLKYKIDFECGGRKYSRFAMTDPMYYDRRAHRIDRAAVVLSIADDEWSRENRHYIYAAKIFDLARKAHGGKKRQKLRTMGMWAAAALLIAAGFVLANAPKVYVPPYSGAQYHLDEICERMHNPSAAYCLPAPLAKLFYSPCGVCAASNESR